MTAGVDPPVHGATGDDGGEFKPAPGLEEEEFKPTGTVFILAVFVATIILLWGSVYVILLARGVTM